ncbi:MAG: cobaltochelatase subunit CobN, partial [Acetobacteraceae bacterium]|nr:cobaltochelatase subunit CobN [Acetobacteraceae bacterium]
LRRTILDLADQTGLLAESGAASDLPEDDRLARLDAYLCDVKDAQISDGLHVFGDAPGEWDGLLAALWGRFVPPGPAGAPSRGRADVLPTGRNLYAIDPRAVPTPTAMTLAATAAAELLRRHVQDQGDYPRSLVLNLWGSTTMRTGGEDLALAMILLGVSPVRDEASGRVTGVEVIPLALLDRPRVDVTLRISGLFRDAFAAQIELFDMAVRAVAARDEAADWNPLAGTARATRIFGPAPGCYGAGLGAALDSGRWTDRAALGQAYLDASSTGYGLAAEGAEFAAVARTADAFVHIQDHRETDLLEGSEFAAHTGGFAALADSLGAAPALYHADTGAPDAPRIRTAPEEVTRIVRARAANPLWLAGMRRHGYRGAAEIARALDGLFAYAATVPHRFDAQFDLLWGATLGDADIDGFLRAANPQARDGMAARFDDARARGLWHPRRNDVGAAP